MSEAEKKLTLYEGAVISGLSYDEIWQQQAVFGGTAGPLEIEAYVLGLLRPDPHQHNLIAQAINERFIEQGGDHPVSYADSVLG